MYLYFYNVSWPETAGRVGSRMRQGALNFRVVIFILAFCSMGQTVSSVDVGQDGRSAGVQWGQSKTRRLAPVPAFFSVLVFLFLMDTRSNDAKKHVSSQCPIFFDCFAVQCPCKFVSRTTCKMSVQKKKNIIKRIQSSQGVII